MLEQIVAEQKNALAALMRDRPLASFAGGIKRRDHLFARRLLASDWFLIAECKLTSPVKGRLGVKQSVSELAAVYEQNGAGALSVHTNKHFAGRPEDVAAVRAIVTLPIMRKEFIIHPYQVYETAYLGADALLLIARILSGGELAGLLAEADALGLDCLVEVHDRADMEKSLAAGAKIIGINNRDLTDFTTDIQNTLRLLPLAGGVPVVGESGFKTRADVLTVKAAGARGALIGEGLTTAADIGGQTRIMALREE